MNKKVEDTSFFNSANIVFFTFKWRNPIIIITLIATIAAIVFSGSSFIKPKYQSTVIFFPTTTNSISRALLSENAGDKQDILQFGEEEQAEQLLQILNSDVIRNRIIKKYDLMNHYQIDTTERFPYTRLYREYKDNIQFERTEFMSVRIEVLDTDPQKAADIANDIAALLDSTKNKIQKERAVEGFKIVEREYHLKLDYVRSLEDSLTGLRNKGIFDYGTQSEILSEEYTKALSNLNTEAAQLKVLEQYNELPDTSTINTKARIKGAEAKVKNLEAKLDILAELGGASVSLTEVLSLEREQLSLLKERYDKAKVDAEQILPHKFVVNYAVKAEKKSYPIRWLIVLTTMLSSFILGILIMIALENLKKLKYRV